MTDNALHTAMLEKQAALTIARDNARLQLNGLENQLYVLDQLLNPAPEEPEPGLEPLPAGTI